MFDKLKQLKELRDLQKQIEAERYEAERGSIKVVVNGGLTIESITLDPNRSPGEQAADITACVNDALKKAQYAVSQRVAGMMR